MNFNWSDCDLVRFPDPPYFQVSRGTRLIAIVLSSQMQHTWDSGGAIEMMQEERRKSEKLKRADRGNLSALRQYPFSNAPISFSSTALQQLIPVHHIVECCTNDKKQAKVQNSQSLLHCLVQCSVALCVCDALPLLRPVLLMPTMTGSLAAACQPQLKLKKIGCHGRTRKSKKVQQSPKAQIEKNRLPRQNEKKSQPGEKWKSQTG